MDNAVARRSRRVAIAAIAQRFRWGAVDGKVQAHIVTFER